ncbi:hypothetical protein [Streptomyces candidus]|uniref:Uncharacterized protein n=1 Tax=Streptomyces candidus TaxID=67283 RepID=A0A7X0LPW7_9ACTN|nr:hypothetical protein [Streptomyces candidus]MBB6435899.1 hypothetical protein [Streptomyces candidus]GHH42888.1 hypothetical protein GCM10018773_27990 [Streptomyces candidus]
MAEQPSTAFPALSAENLEALMLDERTRLFSRALSEEEIDALYGMLPDELVIESRVLAVAVEMSAHGATAAPQEVRFAAADRVARLPDAGLPLHNEAEWKSGQDSHMEIDICRLMAQLPAGPLAGILATLPAGQQDRLRSTLARMLADHTPPPHEDLPTEDGPWPGRPAE